MFEQDGCRGAEIYAHSNFLSYLGYFLYGADLPEAVIGRFEEKAGNPERVTSSDIIPISDHARKLAREFRLDRLKAAEAFFKLSLDAGLSLSTARNVRRSATKLR